MDFDLNSGKILPPPVNIVISSPKGPGNLLVTWDPVRKPDGVTAINYNVYRSTSLGGIFYKVHTTSADKNITRFEDNNVGRNPNTQYFYKVSTIADGVEGELSPPVIFHIPTTNKWFKKINERNMWILKNTGVLMDLYIKKTEGERCKVCWDDIRRQSSDPDCTNCFGTTFDGGYEPMTQLYVRQKPATQNLSLTPQGYALDSSPGAWTISKISINSRDLLINPQGKIFQIGTSHVSHAAGYLFHQELTMSELDPMDRLYKIKRATLYPEF